jgi:predicted DNA-binding WGR domain protein
MEIQLSRYFELSDSVSNKFWEILVEGNAYTVRHGRMHSEGKKETKYFSTDEEARLAYEKLILQKTKKGYVEKTPPSLGDQLLRYAHKCFRDERWHEAVDLYDRANRCSYLDYVHRANFSWAASQVGLFDEALQLAAEVMSRETMADAAKAHLLMVRGFAYAGLKQYDHAIRDYSEALKLNPYLKDIYVHRAAVFDAIGDSSKANQDRQAAV